MKLFVLEFAKGQFDYFEEILLGIYTTKEKRDEAIIKYSKDKSIIYALNARNNLEGEFVQFEVETDEDIMLIRKD